jgi:amino acid adenylation domain-containing protein
MRNYLPLESSNLVELLRERAQTQPDRLAFTFLADGKEEGDRLTYAEIDVRARSIAALLQQRYKPGERALLIYPQGLGFICSFFGCLYSGLIAIPVPSPLSAQMKRALPRLEAIVEDARPSVVLTTAEIHAKVQELEAKVSGLQNLPWLATENDEIPVEPWRMPPVGKGSLAYLQYTSGSTSAPKGVMVSHGNLLSNLSALAFVYEHGPEDVMVSWLPHFHDLGLIFGILQPVYNGFPCVLMSPLSFIKQPFRWLQAISRYRGTHTAAPNFAYDLCVEAITAEQRAFLDLSSLCVALNGAETVRRESLERFVEVFGPCGFRRNAFSPAYGLAEATLKVCAAPKGRGPYVNYVQVTALEQNLVLEAQGPGPGVQAVIGCGSPVLDTRVVIAHPGSFTKCHSNEVGEIWVSGTTVAQGYWNRPQETKETFQAFLRDGGEGPFLRTGDLGFILDGQVFITGRLKDLIIIRGLNHYPQDIELTVQRSHEALQPNANAAFSVNVAGEERLVVVQEMKRGYQDSSVDEIVEAIRPAVAEHHGVEVHAVVLVSKGSIPKTSSGKIQRRSCRDSFLAGKLEVVGEWIERVDDKKSGACSQGDETQRTHDEEMILRWLLSEFSTRFGIDADHIDVNASFAYYGLDSKQSVRLIGDLEVWLGRRLSPTLPWDYPSMKALAGHLAEADGSMKPALAPREKIPVELEPIAIVGIGCRFPGANGQEEFWSLLHEGKDAVTEISSERWNRSSFALPDLDQLGKINIRRGGYLEQVEMFDPAFFSISPREAEQMDPQQRLLLEVVWEALENAGQAPSRLAGSRTGVFIGISTSDYSRHQFQDLNTLDAYAGAGIAHSIAANRISYLLDLRGPSLAVDTACSSSLVAVHLACQSLRTGESSLALAGGVNLILSPELSIIFSQARMLASDGRCKTFDANADGYVRAEGAGIVVLKRLSDALHDNNEILALIRGSAINQDGRTNGLTAPSGLAQQEVIREALRNASVSPAEIGYVEAHGTGTPLGDPIELQALAKVLREGRLSNNPCLIGSVKTNIGHLEAAAGIAGLIKAALCLKHEEIPPHLHVKELNPNIVIERMPLEIITERRSWPSNSGRRFAGVSSFGFGGANAHVVIESAPLPVIRAATLERHRHLLALSAQSESALKELANRYHKHIAAQPAQQLQNICFTANCGRSHFPYRLGITAGTNSELMESLQDFIAGKRASSLTNGYVQRWERPKIVFLFSGQGAQYPGMARLLYETQPTFRKTLDHCAEILGQSQGLPLQHVLYPKPGESTPLHETEYTQTSIFALEYALSELWRSWGIIPDAVLGHSIGEYTAACVAGVFDLDAGLKLVAERGSLMQSLPRDGEMAVIFASEEQVRAVLADSPVSIAAINGPLNLVISGPSRSIRDAVELLESKKISTRRLEASHAFHSALMDPILGPFEAAARQVYYQAPRIPMVSNLTGQIMSRADVPDAFYWRQHLRQPVRFAEGITQLAAEGFEVFIELGPNPTLLSLGKRCLPEGKSIWLPSLRRGEDDWRVMLDSLSKLYALGVDIDWSGFDRDYSRKCVPLPTYPFERKRFWVRSNVNQVMKENATIINPAIGTRVERTRREEILIRLKAITARLLQIDPEAIDVNVPFLEMGADSLILLEAIRQIQETFAVQLTVRQMFEDFTTLTALAGHLAATVQMEPPLTEAHQNGSESVWSAALPTRPTLLDSQSPTGRRPASLTNGTALERILSQQLETLSGVLSQQLDLLRNTPFSLDSVTAAANSDRNGSHGVQVSVASDSPRSREWIESSYNSQSPFIPYQPIQPGSIGGLTTRQQRHLDSLIARYTSRTRTSKQKAQAYRAVLADNRASAGFRLSIKEMLYPIIGEKSSGSKVWDIDGNVYIDLTMGFGVNLFGHRATFITRALEEQLEHGIQLGPQSLLAGEVASLISELTGMQRVTFCNSGTEAVMTALRLARATTGRKKIALFAGSYHGTFDGVLTRARIRGDDFLSAPMASGVPENMVIDVLVLPYGDDRALDLIKTHASELAAVLVEPVQSRRPDLQPTSFLKELRRLTSDGGIALIFDEIITGFRIHPGGAQAWFGIEADLATYGKVLGGGLPIGVVAGKSLYMDAIDGGMWGYGDGSYPQAETTFFAGTFCKHPLAMAAARAVLMHLKTEGPSLQRRLNQLTDRTADHLNSYFTEHEAPVRVVNFGSLFRFASSANLDLLYYHLLDKGVYIWEGRNCFLSTAHSDEDLNCVIEAVKTSLEEMREGGFLISRSEASKKNGSAPQLDPRRATTDRIGSTDGQPAIPGNGHLRPDGIEQLAPLSDAQKEIWILTQMSADALNAYSECVILELKGVLQHKALLRAFQKIVDRHEALRTTISPGGDSQRILPAVSIDIPFIALSRQQGEDPRSRAMLWVEKQSHRSFDLVNGPLVDLSLIKLDEDLHLLIFRAHHIVVDAWSIAAIFEELSRLYRAECEGTNLSLQKGMQFRQYVEWLRVANRREGASGDESYWLGQFADSIPVLELPLDHPRPPVKTYKGGRQSLILDRGVLSELKNFGRQQGCTLFMTLLAGYMALLHRLTGQEDLVVGIPASGRGLKGSDSLVGYCLNVLPIRSRLYGNPTIRQYLTYLRGVLLNAYEHQEYPFTSLINKLNPPRDASRSAIISTTFNLDQPVNLPEMLDLEVDLILPPKSYAKFDFCVDITEINEELRIPFDYNADLFDASTVLRMLEQYEAILRRMIAHSDHPIGNLPVLTAAEQQMALVEWSDTETQPAILLCLHQIFEAQSDRTPDAMAVVIDEEHVTYQELERRANQLSHYLQTYGVGPEVRVGICLERSLDLLTGILGVLKTGGAYVPIDLSYPLERTTFILEDSETAIFLAREQQAERLPAQVGQLVIYLDTDWQQISRMSYARPVSGVAADNLAYVIYTSGSTGKPKGVLVEHKGLLNLAEAQIDAFAVGPDDHVLQFASMSFDASVFEMLMAFRVGATLYLGSNDSLMPGESLAGLLRDQAITAVTLPPSALTCLPEKDLPALAAIVVAGEACSEILVANWASGRRFFNAYGPTEATVWTTVAKCLETDERMTIGRPVANTQIYLLDSYLQSVPIGVAGEAHIGGIGLARGYLKRADLTAEKFIPHPFGEQTGKRLYKTGDLARYLSNGKIEFQGRLDQQVKLRGFRIELEEVQTTLSQHPAVKDSVVVMQDDKSGNKYLNAYVVVDQNQPPTISELKTFLTKKLPYYMVPSVLTTIEALPLTPNGKVDRKALPDPDGHRPDLNVAYLAPQTEAEQTIAAIWQKALHLDAIGVNDKFFDLGGNSLLMIEVNKELQMAFNREIQILELFQYPTISSLANHLSRKGDRRSSFDKIKSRILKHKAVIKQQS